MNDTIVAAKAKVQHDKFRGKVFAHFSRPKARFMREATYGILASSDTKLSSIVRTIEDDVAPIQTEKRLSRNIDDETLDREISAAILSKRARYVRKDTLILVDWRIEETIRFVKQEYGFENIRVHTHNAIRNMASLVPSYATTSPRCGSDGT